MWYTDVSNPRKVKLAPANVVSFIKHNHLFRHRLVTRRDSTGLTTLIFCIANQNYKGAPKQQTVLMPIDVTDPSEAIEIASLKCAAQQKQYGGLK